MKPEEVTDEIIEAVENSVGMGVGGWDMVDPREIIAASVNAVVNGILAGEVVNSHANELERLQKGLLDIKRELGPTPINNGTSTLGLFVGLLLGSQEAANAEPPQDRSTQEAIADAIHRYP
jgi:hypothetical protein